MCRELHELEVKTRKIAIVECPTVRYPLLS